MSAADLCHEIEARRLAALERRTEAYPRSQPIASDLGACTREMVLAITHWTAKPLPSPELKARFERGNLIEDAAIIELAALGVRVRVDRRAFEVKDRQARVILRGRIDGFIEWNGGIHPMEVKSLDPNMFRRIETVDDFGRYPWLAKWPRQLCAYLYAENLTEGFFLLDDCLGHWKLIPVALDFEAMERILRQCEAAVAHRDTGTLPDYHEDPAVCRRCWAAGRVCDPPWLAGGGYQVLAVEHLEEQIRRREELAPAAAEYDAVDQAIKLQVREKDGVLVGPYLIQGQWVQKRPVPAREAYTPAPYWITRITRLDQAPEEHT